MAKSNSRELDSDSSGACINSRSQQDPRKSTIERRKKQYKTSKISKTTKSTSAWDRRFEELREFYREHGHSDVPSPYPENPGLSRWVKRQRWEYAMSSSSSSGGPNSTQQEPSKASSNRVVVMMTPDRIVKLMTLNFTWNLQARSWESTYSSLLDFKKKHGHTNVPYDYQDSRLAQWVRHQRFQIRRFYNDGPLDNAKQCNSCITPDRMQRLYDIGFSSNSDSADKKWDENGSQFPRQKVVEIPCYEGRQQQPFGISLFHEVSEKDTIESSRCSSEGKGAEAITSKSSKMKKVLRLSESACAYLVSD